MEQGRLFHVSENPDIKTFIPRPSPSYFKEITGNVVFAINDRLLHNYLLPRDCPRVCYYARQDSSTVDIANYISPSGNFVMALEYKWKPIVEQTVIYLYELPAQTFTLLDECAGYYISYEPANPLSVKPVTNLLEEITKRNVTVKFVETLKPLSEMIKNSTLNYSIIRMRNGR